MVTVLSVVPQMISDQFRRQLRQEAKLWQAEGLIDSSVYQQLSERYQFDRLETASRDRFVMILLGLGGILLGLGVITFVAANWQAWPRIVKLTLLLTLFLGVNIGGFYLWRSPTGSSSGRWQRVGEGLLLFGALILGANLALTAQMFHIGGDPYGLFLVWGLGVLAMSYSLRLTSLGVLALLLIGCSYCLGVSELFSPGEFSGLELLLKHLALVAGFLGVPLAYWCRSRAIFLLSLLLLLPALQVSFTALLYLNFPVGLYLAIACTLPLALLWGYDDTIWRAIDSKRFQPLARNLAVWLLSLLFFYFSFRWAWESTPSSFGNRSEGDGFLLVDVAVFTGVTIWEWFQLAKPNRMHPHRWGLDAITSAIAGFLIVSATVCFWHLNVSSIPSVATFIFNVQLFLFAAGLIRVGLARAKRGAFWGGLVLLTLQIVSRMFEYNTELLLKSFVFVLCGVGVITAGLWFERHLSTLSPSQEDSP